MSLITKTYKILFESYGPQDWWPIIPEDKAKQEYNIKKKTEFHHKNEDWHDHTPSNIMEICRGCHTKQHITEARRKNYLKRTRNELGQFAGSLV